MTDKYATYITYNPTDIELYVVDLQVVIQWP
jgi:hypothetical protein